MKRIFKSYAPTSSISALFALSLIAFLAIPAAFSAEETEAASKPKTATKTAARSVPVQDLFDTSNAKVEAVADSLEYKKDAGKLIARGNAVITYQGTKILADYAEVETDSKKAYAKGHVMIFKGTEPRLQGEEIYYDFANHTGSFPNATAMNPPWVAKGEDIQQIREGVSTIRNGGVTTCPLDKPHYEIRSKKATLYANEKLIMHGATIYILGTPVFWLPWMDIPLNWPDIPVQAKTGFSSQYGAYLELEKKITFNQYLSGKAHADWYSKRGFGGGWDQYYNFGKYAHGSLQLYAMDDKKAPNPKLELTNGDPYSEREDRKRGRITWRHRTDIDDNTNILLRYHRVSDKYFLQDFFEDEYRSDMQPNSFVTGTHNTERYGLLAHATMKMNSYESMVERLPELRADWKNQPFYKELVYNESRIQFDNLAKRYDHSTTKQTAVRTDAYTNFTMPLKWKDVNFMPFAGYRGTEFSHQATTDQATYRSVIDYGADLRTHFYKMFDVSFDKFGVEVNQLRHVFVPSVTFKGTESTVGRDKLTQFDNVDVIDNNQEVVMGMANRLQTKRIVNGKTERVDVVSLNTYLHFEAQPRDTTVEGASMTDFENTLTLRPYEWLQFQSHFDYDFAGNFLKFANNDVVVRKGRLKLVFGHRYVHQHNDWYTEQMIQGSDQFMFDARYQVNPLWEVGGYVRFDSSVVDNNDPNNTATSGLQEWQLSATRDLHDFILEFGYNCRRSTIDTNNNELFFNIRMKGLPLLGALGSGSRATFSQPRIGETVAGANETAAWADPNPLLSEQGLRP